MLLAFAVLFQSSVGANGVVICRHLNGTAAVENLVQQVACHMEVGSRNQADTSLSAGKCTDEATGGMAVVTRGGPTDGFRILLAPLLISIPLPEVVALPAPINHFVPWAHDSLLPAAQQHSLISAVILQV